MVRYELFHLALVSLVLCVTSEEALKSTVGNITKKVEPPDKLILQKSQPYSEKDDQQSFMSNIVSWIFPFSKQAEDRGDFSGGYQYPSPSQSHIEKDCNACNNEPWIPIASSVGEKTVINFLPPVKNYGPPPPSAYSDLSVLEALHPPPPSYIPPAAQYSPPATQYSPPGAQYGPPGAQYSPPAAQYNPPLAQYGPPFQFRLKDTRNNFGPVKRPQQFPSNGDIVVVDYMVPPPINYKVPSLIYGPPKSVYGAPPPSKPIYGPPPSKPKPIYGPVPPQFGPNHYLDQSPPQFIPPPQTTYLQPISQDIAPPPQPVGGLSNIHHQLSAFGNLETDLNAPISPSDSYGAPVTGDSLNFFSPPEQLSLGNEKQEYIEKPIPLPNLSSFPVLPFRKYSDFNQNYIQGPQTDHTEVKIQESVKIADYLAAIEHPINVIQSPLIDLSIKDDTYDETGKSEENFKSGGESNIVYSRGSSQYNAQESREDNYIRGDKAQKHYSNINEKLKSVAPTKLSDNPIIVEDVHAAASSNNDTFVNSNEIQVKRSKDKELGTPNANSIYDLQRPVTGSGIIKSLLLDKVSAETSAFKKNDYIAINNNFSTPSLDYSNWTPTFGVTMSSVKLPIDSTDSSRYFTTKKPKLLQIIVPYVTSKQPGFYEKEWKNDHAKPFSQIPSYTGAYTTLLPVFTPPETTQVSLWSKYSSVEVKPVTPTPVFKATTAVYNIKELLDNRPEQLPYDIISLQKHIDDWTQQAYSLNTQREKSTHKEIPSEYFTTTPVPNIETTTLEDIPLKKSDKFDDGDVDSNLVIPTTETPTTKSSTKTLWNVSHVTISPQSKEKVYIVTPQAYSFYTSTPATAWSSAPRVENGKVNNGSTYDSYKFSIRVEPQNKTSKEKLKREGKGAVKIVYSEWPHLINDLQTTSKKPPPRHPLFGLMDIPSYTPPPNSTVETILGHSRVALAVTQATVSEAHTRRTTSRSTT